MNEPRVILDGMDFTGIDGSTTTTPMMYLTRENWLLSQADADNMGIAFFPTHNLIRTWKVAKNRFGYYGAYPITSQYVNIKTGKVDFSL